MALDLALLGEQARELPSLDLIPIDPKVEFHVDGDYAAYYYSGKDDTPLSDSKRNLENAISVAARLAGAGGRKILHLTHPLSDKGGRFKLATVKPYQDQRTGKTKPKNWEALRIWLESTPVIAGHRVVQWKDREADDGGAAAARWAWANGSIPGIFARDKDWRMIPGRHIEWTTLDRVETNVNTWELVKEDVVYGTKFFWLQMLMGDSADNIPGVPGVPKKGDGFKNCGESCANSILAGLDARDTVKAVIEAYRTYYGASWPVQFAEQASLLWLRNDNQAAVDNFRVALPFVIPELDQAIRTLKARLK